MVIAITTATIISSFRICISVSAAQIFFIFHSFHGKDELNKLACSQCKAFIAQMVEHCSANAEAVGWNPVEVPPLFFGFICNCLNYNRPFYRYSGHIELIRFKEYYRMPRGYEHISFVFSSAFPNIFT